MLLLKSACTVLLTLHPRSGLEPVPEKLENLKKIPPHTDVTGVRKFLDFVGYYRKFIPRYSVIARLLTNLTHKDEVFDVSKYAWAAVLTKAYQHNDEKGIKEIQHHITYISGLFRGPQINWAALVKEAYAIYMSTRKLDYYLDEEVTTIRSDHLPLKKFLEHKTPTPKTPK